MWLLYITVTLVISCSTLLMFSLGLGYIKRKCANQINQTLDLLLYRKRIVNSSVESGFLKSDFQDILDQFQEINGSFFRLACLSNRDKFVRIIDNFTLLWLNFRIIPNHYFIISYEKIKHLVAQFQTLLFSLAISNTLYLCECGWFGPDFHDHTSASDCPANFYLVKLSPAKLETWTKKLAKTLDNCCLITGESFNPQTEIAILSCGHAATLQATVKWVFLNQRCFLCQEPLDSYNYCPIESSELGHETD